jgi:NADH-quinone oxidoreductase subunit E
MILDQNIRAKIDEMRPYFPTEQALLIPLLHEIQFKEGWVSVEAMKEAGAYLKLPLSKVLEVATFYTMFNKKPVGKNHVQLCTNVSCYINGSDKIKKCIERKLGIKNGETTKDAKFTFTEVECLGACGTGPVMQVNLDYVENLTVEKTEQVLQQLERGEKV